MEKLIKLLKNKLISDSGSVLVFRCLGILLSFVLIRFIASTYGAEVYGRYSIVITMLEFLAIIASLGIPTSIVKLSADKSFFSSGVANNNFFYSSVGVLMVSGFLVSLVMLCVKEFISFQVFKDKALLSYFSVLVYGVPLYVFYLFLCEFERGRFNFIVYGLARFALLPLLTLCLIYFVKINELPQYYLIASFILAIVFVGFVLFLRLPFNKLLSKNVYGVDKLLAMSLPMMLSSSFIFVTNWTDVFMLGVLASKSDLGVYSVAFKLSTISILIVISVNSVVAPTFSRLYELNKVDELKAKVLESIKLISVLTIPIIFFIGLFGEQLLQLFGDEFTEGYAVLVIILIGNFFNAITGTVGALLNMTRNHKSLQIFTLVSAVLNIILNYCLIDTYGIIGAAVSTVISSIVLNLLCVLKIKTEFGFYAIFQR